MKSLITLSFLIATVTVADAQKTIKPGDQMIRYDWIRASHNFYRNQVSDTAGNITYDFMMENFISIDKVSKKITFARYRQVPAGSFEADTSVTDLAFKPIRMHEVHPQRDVTYEMTFGESEVKVNTRRKGVSADKTFAMKPGYFEDNMIEYILGYLDLKKGVTYTLDNFNKDAPVPSDPYTIEYIFDDVWQLTADHKVKCTVLHFTHGGTTGYVWIDSSTHQPVKTIANFINGSYLLNKM
jgi:hypothetical protein